MSITIKVTPPNSKVQSPGKCVVHVQSPKSRTQSPASRWTNVADVESPRSQLRVFVRPTQTAPSTWKWKRKKRSRAACKVLTRDMPLPHKCARKPWQFYRRNHPYIDLPRRYRQNERWRREREQTLSEMDERYQRRFFSRVLMPPEISNEEYYRLR